MCRFGFRFCLFVGFVGGLFLFNFNQADARSQYKKQFEQKYPEVVKSQEDGKITCNTCHEGKDKKVRNIYGKALVKLIGENEKDEKKIGDTLTKVEVEKSAIEGKTFGDLLKEKRLPASTK